MAPKGAVGMAAAPSIPPDTMCRGSVARIERQADHATCILANGSRTLISSFLAAHLSVGDELLFSLPSHPANAGTELLIVKNALTGTQRDLYQAAIGYVSQPKQDKRNQQFVSADVRGGGLGISNVFLPCSALREYFYRIPENHDAPAHHTLYETLRVPATASPAELRVAFKLRALELHTDGAPRANSIAVERAFNILASPELRACYDALLRDIDAPVLFPYGGFGSILVSGERSRDGLTFFAHRILGFLPQLRQRRFHAPLRRCEFYDDRALYQDLRRKLELWLDPAVLHRVWDAGWNQWKHLLGAKMEVSGTFVQSGKYRRRHGEWELIEWETAVPSRLHVNLPADLEDQLLTAQRTYQRFGQYSAALDRIRLRTEYQAVEKADLRKMCADLGIPGDFDIAQISWRPDYDPFFYRQLERRSRRLYLFRNEYVFELDKIVVVETPQLGHATYIFAKPRNMENFLTMYTRSTKDDIRHNRDNIAERLRFLGRIVHGVNPRVWLTDLRRRAGEKVDYAMLA
jgi:hypothetical protein